MDKYTELLERVKTYIQDDNNPEVKNGEISLSDLYHILDEEFKKLYKEKEAEELLESINSEYTIVKKVGNFFRKKEVKERIVEYESANLSFDSSTIRLVLFEKDREKLGRTGILSVSKDEDSNELYSSYHDFTSFEKEIVEKYYEEIQDILISLQEYRDITGITNSYSNGCVVQEFSDGFMNIKITYDYYARIQIEISIEKSIDQDEISKREYVRRDKIQDVINDNKLQILRKVVVDENTLNDGCKKIIERRR